MKLDPNLARRLVTAFPGPPWERIDCSSFGSPNDDANLRYETLADYNQIGGNYAFLLPRGVFRKQHEITLHGPKKRPINFRFFPDLHPHVDGMMVVYSGKATDLTKRLKQHFQGAKATTANQVKRGLSDSKISNDFEAARSLMLRKGVIFLCKVDGDENVANRDLIELMMCSAYAAPFNIKSEH